MLSLDHVVIASKNILKSSAIFAKHHHIHTVAGGNHENWGTKNILAYMKNDCYIEWIGIENKEIATRSHNPLIQHLIYQLNEKDHGAFQIAFRTNYLASYVTHFKRKNIPFIGPVLGERKRKDGSVLSWQMLFPLYDAKEKTLPFLISWDQSFEKRVEKDALNEQTMPSVSYSGISLQEFAHIYQVRPDYNKRKISLQNAEVLFPGKSSSIEFQLT